MKRGESGLSLIVGVDKPAGMTSHDVVNRARRIFGEKRVGHTGTLDPMASGVLPICVGPATRLASFLTAHDKSYRASIKFGFETDTDDACGSAIRTASVPDRLFDETFSRNFLSELVGEHMQMPPAYSAIKVGGKKACDEARAGRIIELKPRPIEVLQADLRAIETSPDDGSPVWVVDFCVSKGTYIRALARDIGRELGTCAHLSALRRLVSGSLSVQDCVSLETLSELGKRAALDPVRLLGCRFLYADGALASLVGNGNILKGSAVTLFEYLKTSAEAQICACTSGVCESARAADDGEVVAVIADNILVALYSFDQHRAHFKPCCVFQTGVLRGSDI